jgi:DNA-directed RNA polymerase subunit H (RpoH/RPB5)
MRRAAKVKINTTQTVADALNISTERVRQIVRELNITPTQIGRMFVLSDADVKKIEKRNTQVGRPKKSK